MHNVDRDDRAFSDSITMFTCPGECPGVGIKRSPGVGADGRSRQTREYFERPGEVDLIDAIVDQRADVRASPAGAAGTTISTTPVATSYTSPESSHGAGKACVARSASTSTATAARGFMTSIFGDACRSRETTGQVQSRPGLRSVLL